MSLETRVDDLERIYGMGEERYEVIFFILSGGDREPTESEKAEALEACQNHGGESCIFLSWDGRRYVYTPLNF